jgi:uncharacterized repeat protein (TIGR03803 family)
LGTVFVLTGDNTDKILHNFPSFGNDGTYPTAGLIDVGSTLYGTTSKGGKYGYGTVFRMSTSGSEKVLHNFPSFSNDGKVPLGGLIDVGGTIYGTTWEGGSNAVGTVFTITPSGAEKVLYSFKNNPDGAAPFAGLTNVSGTLYGTTQLGGTDGNGTVFRITTRGKEKPLYSFGSKGDDGLNPAAGLTYAYGALWGTTQYGGTKCAKSRGCGTVFSITTGGTETVQHNFAGGNDGAAPYAGLTNVSGTGFLFGTTSEGGKYGSNGTVFEISLRSTRSGSYGYYLSHTFGNGTDGRTPYATMIYVAGNLIGTTDGGGISGYGTVFSLPASERARSSSRATHNPRDDGRLR